MILHKYLDQCYNTLSDLELKETIPTKLNDPFEFTFADPTSLIRIDLGVNCKDESNIKKNLRKKN